jgi:hypothetical protein
MLWNQEGDFDMSLYVCNEERCAAAGVGLPSTVYIHRTFHNGVRFPCNHHGGEDLMLDLSAL